MARDSSGAKVAACHATENWVDWPNLIWLAAMGKEENKRCMKIGLQQRTIRTKWLKDQNRSRYFCFNFFSRCLLLKVWMTMHHKMSASALRTCWVKALYAAKWSKYWDAIKSNGKCLWSCFTFFSTTHSYWYFRIPILIVYQYIGQRSCRNWWTNNQLDFNDEIQSNTLWWDPLKSCRIPCPAVSSWWEALSIAAFTSSSVSTPDTTSTMDFDTSPANTAHQNG